MQVNDEIAHLRVVDRLLRFGLPCRVGGRVVGIDADDIELLEIFEFNPFDVRELAAEHQVQQLLTTSLAGHEDSLYLVHKSRRRGQPNLLGRSRRASRTARCRERPAASRGP